MAETTQSGPAVTVIRARRGWEVLSLREMWRYRELACFLCWRDIKVRYKQTALGILWAFIQPFTKMVVFTLVFGQLAKIDSEGFPYSVFMFAGLLPWQFFSEALNRSSQSVVNSSHLITKVYFPRLIIPVSSIGACLVDFAVSFLVLAGLMVYYSVPPTAALLMVVPLTLCTILAALGVGALLSALEVRYRDFRHAVPFLVQVWMFLTPVIYPVSMVPEKWRWLLMLNPMSGIVDAWRSALLGRPFDWGYLSVSFGVAVLVLIGSLIYFQKLEREFADVV